MVIIDVMAIAIPSVALALLMVDQALERAIVGNSTTSPQITTQKNRTISTGVSIFLLIPLTYLSRQSEAAYPYLLILSVK